MSIDFPTRTRNYCFTLNNYTNEDCSFLKKLKCKYIIYGYEKGEQGTPHLQGFVIWNNAKSFKASQKCLPARTHIEAIKGTPYDNFRYCSKGGDFFEAGDRPDQVGQGKRKDLLEIKKCIAQQTHIKALLENNTIINYQQLKYAETLKKYYEQKRKWKTKVSWFYGETGTGKSHEAHELFNLITDEDNIYEAMDTGRWWDGYDGQEYIIIDDMRKDFLKFHQLLKLLDKYAYRVETKGGTRQFLAKHIIITAPYHPADMFDTREDLEQLLRRIDEIKQFTQKRT